MAGKQIGNDSFSSSLAGMSKNQLYDIMSQMKILIEQNQQQARQILVENPLLTKALFQAQIMLGMVQPPQVMPNIQQTLSQQPQQSAQPGLQLNVQVTQPLPAQPASLGHSSSSQPQILGRQPPQIPPSNPTPSASVPPLVTLPPSIPTHSLQAKGHLNPPATSMSLPQPSQIHNLPMLPLHSAPQPSSLQPQVPLASSQAPQSSQSTGSLHQPLLPPLPQLPRPPSLQPFAPQFHPQMGHNLGFQTSAASPQLISQAMFHSGTNAPASMGPSSFPQGQPPLPSQPPPQQHYQVGSYSGSDFTGNQAGSSMQIDRGSPWTPSPPENPMGGSQLPGPPSMAAGQMGSGSQPSRPPPLTPEMEKALLQQVMSLTPEQINLLPPEQRHQVLQLQQILR